MDQLMSQNQLELVRLEVLNQDTGKRTVGRITPWTAGPNGLSVTTTRTARVTPSLRASAAVLAERPAFAVWHERSRRSATNHFLATKQQLAATPAAHRIAMKTRRRSPR